MSNSCTSVLRWVSSGVISTVIVLAINGKIRFVGAATDAIPYIVGAGIGIGIGILIEVFLGQYEDNA